MVTHQKVKVVVKAVQVNAVEEVKKKGYWRSLRKQDVIIADMLQGIMPRGRRGIFRVGRKTRWRLHLG